MSKSFPKILTILFLLIFVIQLSCLLVLLTLPQASQAADINFTPQVGIPGSKFDTDKPPYTFTDASTKPIAEYISAIYKYAIGIVGILAAVVLMVGGVLWIVAGGNATQISEAKAWIGAALTGLILALTSYLILSTVNPALVNLKTTNITSVSEKKTASCRKTVNGITTCTDNATAEECKDGTLTAAGCSCCSYEKMTSVIATIFNSNYLCEEGLSQEVCNTRTTGTKSYNSNGYCDVRSSVLSLCTPRQ